MSGMLARRLRRRWRQRPAALLELVALTVVVTALTVVGPAADWMPLAALMVPLLLGSMLLGPRTLPWFVVGVMAALVAALATRPAVSEIQAAAVVCYFLLGGLVLTVGFRRSRLGVAGWRGEEMFVDLRDRILAQGEIPALPEGWRAGAAMAAGGGTLFAGDVVIAVRPDPDRLELVLVDVSGNGDEAGPRGLQLSGAFSALLGAVPADRFLADANEYLLRQGWEEGFATAVHLSLDVRSGGFEVRCAGHPPMLWRTARSEGAVWETVAATGPLLGVIDGARYEAEAGRLAAGDSLLLYTDGLVEGNRGDLDRGIERLQRCAEECLARSGADPGGLAHALVRSLGEDGEDRTAVVIDRSPVQT